MRLGPAFALVLSLVLAATGLTMASARGQAPAAGTVVLCSGGGILVVAVDAEGNPTGPAHLCPDLTLTLIAADGLPQAGFAAPERRLLAPPAPLRPAPRAGREAPPAAARGPPGPVA